MIYLYKDTQTGVERWHCEIDLCIGSIESRTGQDSRRFLSTMLCAAHYLYTPLFFILYQNLRDAL